MTLQTEPKSCLRGLHVFAGRKCPACARADEANAAALDVLVDSIAHHRWTKNRAASLPAPECNPSTGFFRRYGRGPKKAAP